MYKVLTLAILACGITYAEETFEVPEIVDTETGKHIAIIGPLGFEALKDVFSANNMSKGGVSENRVTITRAFRDGVAAGVTTTAPGVEFKIEGKVTYQAVTVRKIIENFTNTSRHLSKEEVEKSNEYAAEASIGGFLAWPGLGARTKVKHYDKTKDLTMNISESLYDNFKHNEAGFTGESEVTFSLKGRSTSFFTATHRAFVEVFIMKVGDKTHQILEKSPNSIIVDADGRLSGAVAGNNNEAGDIVGVPN